MGLLSPWFLAGLAAVGLPLWLHLLRQFKRTPRPFSSLMLFERRIQSSTKRRRFRFLALLAMRLALLCLLAIAFANPFVYRAPGAVQQRTLYIIALDRSFSMRAKGRMEEAKAAGRRVLASLPGNARLQVIAFDLQTQALTPASSGKTEAQAAINSLAPNDAASSYGALARALRVIEQTSGMALRVYIITDAQQTSMPASFTDLQPGPHTTEELLTVGKTVPNRAIESVSAPARIFGTAPAEISGTVRAWNAGAAVEGKVLLVVDGHTQASKEFCLPPSGSENVEFDNVSLAYGEHRAELRLDSSDDLPNDDRFVFSIERLDPKNVLFLYSGGRPSQAFYYKSALESSLVTGLLAQPAAIERLPNLNLSKYAFVVLNDPGRLPESAERKLTDYVGSGGSVLLTVGPATIAAGRVALTSDSINGTVALQSAGSVDSHDPALSGWSGPQTTVFLNTAHILRNGSEHVLARFADNSPLLLEERSGEGRILVFASTLDNSSSDFPLHASYLPFVISTANYLAGEQSVPSSVLAGSPISLRQTHEQSAAADVVGPSGRHELSLSDATRAMTYEPPSEGYYEIQRADGHRALLAVHADRRESDLTQIPADTLDLWKHAARNADVTGSATVAQKAVPWSLWRYALLLVLIAAIIESLFAGRYLRQEEQA